jgi:hypothetical protein
MVRNARVLVLYYSSIMVVPASDPKDVFVEPVTMFIA